MTTPEMPEPVYVKLLGWRTPAWRQGDWCVVSAVEPANASDAVWAIAHASGLSAIENPGEEVPRLLLNSLRVAIAGAREYARAGYVPNHRESVPSELMDLVYGAIMREWERENARP